MLTNYQFLERVFGADVEEGFCCAFPGDPTTAKYPYIPAHKANHPAHNNFFAVSIFSEDPTTGKPRRSPEFFKGLYCLVVDDVGTKLDSRAVRGKLGDPTWRIETSPGNYQWGYKLTYPITDLSVANGLIVALCAAFTGDVAGVNRLVRLPNGINGKLKYGSPSPSTSLVGWSDRTLLPIAAIMILGAESIDPLAIHKLAVDPSDDPVLTAMTNDDHPWDFTSREGTYDIQCPWLSDHSDGRDDGTAYIAPAGFKCHHGHCSTRTFKDLRKFLGLTAAEIDNTIRDAAVEASLAPGINSLINVNSTSPAVPDTSDDIEVAVSTTPPGGSTPTGIVDELGSVKRFHIDGKRMEKVELNSAYPRSWLFKALVSANSAYLLAGGGGLGKSRLALAMCMSTASGLPWGPFEPANRDGVRTMFLTQEDDDAEKGHRYTTQLRWMESIDKRWSDPDIQARLEINLFLPDIDPAEGLSKRLVRRLIADQGRNGPLQHVVWDPLIMFWQEGEDEQGLNSASGARDTINTLASISKAACIEAGLSHSVGFVHHRNKSGAILGSIMLPNLVRTVFELERDEAASQAGNPRGTLTITKANGIALTGAETLMYLKTPDAVVHFPSDFATKSREQRVADLFIEGIVPWEIPSKRAVTEMESRLVMFGDTLTERRGHIRGVLDGWLTADEDHLARLGLLRIPAGKNGGEPYFRPLNTGELTP